AARAVPGGHGRHQRRLRAAGGGGGPRRHRRHARAHRQPPAAAAGAPPDRRRRRHPRAGGGARGGLRRGRRLAGLHPRAGPRPHRPPARTHRAVRLHQLGVGLPDPAVAGADHRVDAVAQPLLGLLPGQDRLRGPARAAVPRAGPPGHDRAAVAHLRPHPGPLRRRVDLRRAAAPGRAGRRARRRDLAVDAHPRPRLRPRLRGSARPSPHARRGVPPHLRRRADLGPDRRGAGARGRCAGAHRPRDLRRHRGRRPGVGRRAAGRQGALLGLRQPQGALGRAGLRGDHPLRAGRARDRRLARRGPRPTGRRPAGRRAAGRAGAAVRPPAGRGRL
ncbi:MAG: putative mRNA-binding protein, partial [uncultured Frankineae bacterium]